MLDTSTAGRGLPKARSINVEANLLTERNQELASLQRQMSRKVMRLTVILTAGLGACTGLFFWLQESTDVQQTASRQAAEASTQLSALRDLKARTEPAMKQEDMRQLVNARADGYLKTLEGFFGNTRQNMMLESLKVELIAGNMKLTIRGLGENYDAYQGFVQRLQRTAGQKNVTPRSARRSTELGPDSMTFEVIQTQSVNPRPEGANP
jgi:hypothetical protein